MQLTVTSVHLPIRPMYWLADVHQVSVVKVQAAVFCQVQFKTDPGFAFKIDPPFPGGLLSSDIGRMARDGGKRTMGASVRIPTFLTAIPVTSDGTGSRVRPNSSETT